MQTQTKTTLATDVLALHNRLHTLLTWAKTIDVCFGLSQVEIVVYWKTSTAHASRQRVPLGDDFEVLFDYALKLLRQAYQQTL